MLSPSTWIEDSEESVATTCHHDFLGELTIEAWHQLGNGISDRALSAWHLSNYSVVHSPVEEDGMSLLRYNINQVIIQFRLHDLAQINFSHLESVLAISLAEEVHISDGFAGTSSIILPYLRISCTSHDRIIIRAT